MFTVLIVTVGVIVSAVRDWSDGRYSKAGCNLKFLLDWAWSRVVHIKDSIDNQTIPLFDHSLAEVDEGARAVLVSLAGEKVQIIPKYINYNEILFSTKFSEIFFIALLVLT